MRVYISGPITGREHDAPQRFEEAEQKLIEKYKCQTINPLTIGQTAAEHADLSQDEYMTLAFAEMSICDAVYFMDGWTESNGCRLEMEYAIKRPMKIVKV